VKVVKTATPETPMIKLSKVVAEQEQQEK